MCLGLFPRPHLLYLLGLAYGKAHVRSGNSPGLAYEAAFGAQGEVRPPAASESVEGREDVGPDPGFEQDVSKLVPEGTPDGRGLLENMGALVWL